MIRNRLSQLTQLLAPGERLTVVVGYDPKRKTPKGADEITYNWCQECWIADVECHPADWNKYGRRAGPIRNQEMVDTGADKCLAFIRDNSRGATDCMHRACRAKIVTEVCGDG